jgi:phage shock protein C
MQKIKHLFERSAFGVCAYLGEKMRVSSTRVRMYFIYVTFVTLGSPIIFYLILAFWVNVKKYIRQHTTLLD